MTVAHSPHKASFRRRKSAVTAIAVAAPGGQSVREPTFAIEIKPFKRSEYDRGHYAVLIDDVQWGWIETKWHGCHGTTYHLSDLHGECTKPDNSERRTRNVPIEARCPSRKQWRIDNIGKTSEEWTTRVTSEQAMVAMVGNAIDGGHLRHPDVRNKEVTDAQAKYQQNQRAYEAEKDGELADKAREVLQAMPGYSSGPESPLYAQDVQQLVDVMKWAQSK